MARKAKPPASTPVFSTAEWAPLIEAVALAEGALGSSDLAEGDLIEHFRSGRLPTAMYRGSTLKHLEPTFWNSLQVVQTVHPSGVLVILVVGLADESSAPHLFVARAPLNKLYSTDPTPSGALPEASDPAPRRKPGPVPKYEWPTVVAAAWICRAKDGESDPTAEEMRAVCERVLPGEYSPRLKEMQKVVNKLRALQNRVRQLDSKES